MSVPRVQSSSRLLLGAAALALLAAPAPAQTLLGVDGTSLLAWEFSVAPGGACPAPIPQLAACNYFNPMCGAIGPAGITAGSLLGDIADDPLTDTFYLSDGFMIEQYSLDVPCGGGMTCAPLNQFTPPPGFGPVLGMCWDNSTPVAIGAGSGVLWITDGRSLAALQPTPCGATLVFGPCMVFPLINGTYTDISIDPSTNLMWACDAQGNVHRINPLTCTWQLQFPLVMCGMTTVFTGIAYDAGTPPGAPVTPALPALYVTDGSMVARFDVSGSPAAPTFAAPSACTPTPAFLSGLDLTQHGVTYGSSRVIAGLDTYGQATTPSGPGTFGLEVTNAPAFASAWLILGYNWPNPGYFCPPLTAAFTNIWVDPTFPGSVNNFGPFPGGCFPIPVTIPSGLPVGLEIFAQFVYIPASGPPALDATNGIAVTLMLP